MEETGSPPDTPPKSPDVEQYLDAVDLARQEEDREILDMEGYGEHQPSPRFYARRTLRRQMRG